MERFFVRITLVGLVLCLLGILLVWLGWTSIERGPDFYQQALTIDKQEAEEASQELTQETAEVAQQIEAGEDWQLAISEEQVNGWFATELTKILEQRNIQQISEPRVKIEATGITLACRWKASALSGVLVLKGQAILDPQQQTVRVELGQIRSGLITVHRDRWEPEAKRSLSDLDLPVTWDDRKDHPEITIDLTELATNTGRVITVQTMEFEEGTLRLRGSSRALN